MIGAVIYIELLFRIPWYITGNPIVGGAFYAFVTLVGLEMTQRRIVAVIEEILADETIISWHDRDSLLLGKFSEGNDRMSTLKRQISRRRIGVILDSLPATAPRPEPVFCLSDSDARQNGGIAVLPGKKMAALMLSQKVVDESTDDELRSAIAHELAHLRRGDTHSQIMMTKWTVIVVGIWAIVLALVPALWIVPVVAIAYGSSMVFDMIIAIPAETRADAMAGEMTGDPSSFADFLERRLNAADKGPLVRLMNRGRVTKLRRMVASTPTD
jgi:Zn-dependent protease with chaperone function